MKNDKERLTRYFDALKRITQFQSVEWLRKNSEKAYGLTPEEAIEMAYENIAVLAKVVIRGERRPK